MEADDDALRTCAAGVRADRPAGRAGVRRGDLAMGGPDRVPELAGFGPHLVATGIR